MLKLVQDARCTILMFELGYDKNNMKCSHYATSKWNQDSGVLKLARECNVVLGMLQDRRINALMESIYSENKPCLVCWLQFNILNNSYSCF